MSDTTIPPVLAPEPPTPIPPAPKGGLSKAALVVGIVAAVLAVIPGPSFVAFVPAIIAIVLGLVALIRKHPTPKRGVAAVVLGVFALIVAIIVSLVVIIGGAAGVSKVSSDSTASTTPSTSSTPCTSSTEPKASTTPSAAPSPKPTTPVASAVSADTVYSGTGDSVVPVVLPDGDGPAAATITANGSSNFAVWSLDANMAQQDLLVNTIGAYTGIVGMDLKSNQPTKALQIASNGPWTVSIHSLASLRAFTGNATTGTSDDVVIYRGAAGAAAITNTGSSNFAVWTYGNRSNLAVNEIGAYTGTVVWQKGPLLVVVTSDGPWTITVR
jgi:hypothetical protein